MASIISKIISDAGNRLKLITNRNLKKAGLTTLKVRYLKYSTNKTPAQYNLNGQLINYINGPELLYSLKEIFIDEIYKIRFDKADPYIIDCGANIGLSIVYFKQNFPESKIDAFEADESNFRLLQRNVSNLPGVSIFNKAVWKDNTEISFASTGTLSSKIVTDPKDDSSKKIEAIRLRDYLNKPIDLLKLDIEGAEYEVLRDCSEKLSIVKNLFIEYHGKFENSGELTEIFGLLNKIGFTYYIKEASDNHPTPFYRDKGPRQYDVQLNIFCFKNY